MSAFKAIKAIDYTVIYARDLAAMRRFYEDVLHLELIRELSPRWIEYRIGPNTLALALPGLTAKDDPVPKNTAALQLAFKVARDDVDACAAELTKQVLRWCCRRPTSRLAIARCSSAIPTATCWRSTRRSEGVAPDAD